MGDRDNLTVLFTTLPTIDQVLQAAPDLHWRQCRDCMRVALHVVNVTPWVLCRNCGSQDTRPVKGGAVARILERCDG